MDKSIFIATIDSLAAAGIKKYMVSTDGINTTRFYNNDTSVIVQKEDYVVVFSLCDNVGNLTKDAVYDIAVLPYENITSIHAIGVSFEEGLVAADELGITGEDAFKDLVKKNKPRQNNNPGVGGQMKFYTKEILEPVLDENGNPVLDENGNPKTITKEVPTLPNRMSHYVVNG